MKRFCASAVCAVLMCLGAVGAPFWTGADFLLQIALERQMFSMNAIDGQWGSKSQAALSAWALANGVIAPTNRAEALALVIAREGGAPRPPFRLRRVTDEDLMGLMNIPREPSEKMLLPTMGYETLLEKFAELGHTTQNTMKLINPGVAWPNPPPGTAIRIPNIVAADKLPRAALVKINLSRRTVSVFDANGVQIALFPCSIAADKSKRPPTGEIYVKGIAPHPNYTYTSEISDAAGKRRKYIYPSGPNNPVGSAWIGLSIPTYGIHGTPNPETIGRAESHGCFRLANWNAERLRDMVDEGCRVVIE